ncbi:unnamed protein product [Orchesella dallaii]|uniref:WD repeat-containing and planar cell polarity effector protein fritz n=1 Tax=Orchesella dallaii TaxID=48710 RepID=A0ABP1PTL9_9HEXA
MVGLFVQQLFLPFYSETFLNTKPFSALKADALYSNYFKTGRQDESASKGKISGIGEFIKKSMKSELGNSTISEVQELLQESKILSLKWRHADKITIILSDGTIIYIWIKNLFTNEYYCDVDRFFKFTEPISDVAYSDQHVLFLFGDNRLLVLRKLSVTSSSQSGSTGSQKSDLLNTEVTVNTYSELIPNIVARRFEKKLAISDSSNQLMIWWSGSKDDVFPWSPKPEQRANILVYSLEQTDPFLISHHKTDNHLLETGFVPNSDGGAYTLELCCDQQGGIIVNEVVYQVQPDKFVAVCETAIPLNSELRCFAYDNAKEKLALGCCDSSIVVYSQEGKVTHYTKAAFIPIQVSWHNDSYLVFAVGDRGQYQIFDIALSPLLLLDEFTSMPSLTKELVPSFSVERMCWCPVQPLVSDSRLLIRFETGTLVILRFAVGNMKLPDLCNFHLTHGHYKEAIKALKYVYWNSDDCLHVMFNIYNFLMRQSPSEEIENNFELLLATYFVPAVSFDEKVRRRHGKPMRVLARRFFMWLIKAKKYPRALQIAVSLGEDKLLKKLHHVASKQGDSTVATEAAFRIMARKTRSSSSESGRSSSPSGSTCSCHSSSGMSDLCSTELLPVSVAIPRADMIVLEPPSPYRNPISSNTTTDLENNQDTYKESNEGASLQTQKLDEEIVEEIQVVHLGPV